LGYVVVRDLALGGVVTIIGIFGNILYFLWFASFARAMDKLQKRIEEQILVEFRKRRLTGRWRFVPVVIFCEVLLVASALHTFWRLIGCCWLLYRKGELNRILDRNT